MSSLSGSNVRKRLTFFCQPIYFDLRECTGPIPVSLSIEDVALTLEHQGVWPRVGRPSPRP
jgi:hypothetical protein